MIYGPWLSPGTCVQGHGAGEGLAAESQAVSFSQPLFRAGGLLIKRFTLTPPARSTQARCPAVPGDGDNVLSALPSQTTSRLEDSGTVFMSI